MKTYEEFQAENEALKVYVEKMRYELAACQSVLYQLARAGEVTPAYADDAKKVLQSTPQQCLAEIQADSIKVGYMEGFKRRDKLGPLRKMWSTQEIMELANQYGERVKAGKV